MIGGFFAARTVKNNPVLSALHKHSEKLISEITQQGGMLEKDVRAWAQQTFEVLIPALNSKNPKIECRKLLVGWALIHSDYQVMMVPPSPEPDWTNLRGLKGVSGELWEARLELARVYEPIRDVVHGASLGMDKEGVAGAIQGLACQSCYLVNMADGARIMSNDYHHDADMDWFRPMMYSFQVSSENKLRKLIGLPTSLDDDMAALMHATMMHEVLGGSRFPDVNWRETYRDQIKRGSLSVPRFGNGFKVAPESR
jgi:hypothetical protein